MQCYLCVGTIIVIDMTFQFGNQFQYYLALGWWLIKISLVIFILIPGTVWFMIGYTISWLYQLLDPDLIVLNFLNNAYKISLGQLPLAIEILLIKIIVLSFLIPYLYRVKQKHPELTWKEIAHHKIKRTVKQMARPQRTPVDISTD